MPKSESLSHKLETEDDGFQQAHCVYNLPTQQHKAKQEKKK